MGKVKYRFAEWCRANGKEKLLNLYSDCNDQSAEEAAFSSAALRKWSCPVCGMTWLGETNKMNRLTPGYYNVIKKRPEETYCPYCKGSSVSPYYSMTTERPWTVKFWDEERNGKSAEALKNEPPNSHKNFSSNVNSADILSQNLFARETLKKNYNARNAGMGGAGRQQNEIVLQHCFLK